MKSSLIVEKLFEASECNSAFAAIQVRRVGFYMNISFNKSNVEFVTRKVKDVTISDSCIRIMLSGNARIVIYQTSMFVYI